MLRSFTTDTAFRALTRKPFERAGATCGLGRRTLIYGRNGSGKTTFSELLRLAPSAQGADGVVATASIRRDSSTSSVRLGSRSFPWAVLVYNRYYVHDSLQLFLDGDGGSPTILKLGRTNVVATQALERARTALVTLDQRRRALATTRKSLDKERDTTEKEVKSEVIAALSKSDPAYYNPTRFQITLAKALLHDSSVTELEPKLLQEEIDVAGAQLMSPVDVPSSFPKVAVRLKEMINDELLGLEVESQPITRLSEDTTLANWVEAGITLHQPGDLCGFCQEGIVTSATLSEYARHFSEALDALRARLRQAITYLTDARSAVDLWVLALPAAGTLLVTHRNQAQEEVTTISALGAELQNQIDEAISLIEARLADPLKPLDSTQRLAADFVAPEATKLRELVEENNRACDLQSERKKQAQRAVELHFGAVYGDAYRACEDRISLAVRAESTLDRRELSLKKRATELEQSQEDTGRMATAIDADLREHFGFGHLNISVSADRKGYEVRRGSKIAKRLSEGERNAVALAYFLRSLGADGIDPLQTIVVIDDPVTSMDKESLFAGFALAEECTKQFAQVIVLTHDYEYFRLQLGQRKNAREKSEKKIRENQANEIAFPAVSVLEMCSVVDPTTNTRVSSLRKLPASLLRHPSEYHYLFQKVAEAVDSEDQETLPLLGNAARRLIEGFISFRAPNGNDFQEKVDLIKRAGSVDDVLARRIVKFLHGQSHREEPRPTSSLDFPSIEAELRAALTFMRKADPDHFTEMCKAVKIEELSLSAAVDVGDRSV